MRIEKSPGASLNEFRLPRAAALSLALLSTSAIVTPAAAQQAPAGPSAQALPGAKQQPLPA
ncbi:unnamed protein product, partial [marine sediment metagenome]